MKEKHLNIKNKSECTGCRACEQLCPVNCITMVEDEEGFIFPQINEEKCINCGLCKQRCPQINNQEKKEKQKVYAVKPKKEEMAKKSTSAGMAYILTENIIEQDGIVFGCAYNEKLEPVQVLVDKMEETGKLRGSKYVFSNTLHTYSETKKSLQEGKKVLYIGTPCQIGGLYAFLGKEYENLITVDIVCHGTPSPKLFLKYIKYLENKYGEKITNYEFRNKDKAIWGEFVSKVTMENNKKKYLIADEDPYYNNFLKGTIYRESCYKCKYSNTNRVGDITLADFWGIEQTDINFYSEQGVSLVITNTEKGGELFKKVNNKIVWKEYSEVEASKKNSNLSHPTQRTVIRDTIYQNIDNTNPEEFVKKNLKIKFSLKNKIKKIIPRKLKKVIKKII